MRRFYSVGLKTRRQQALPGDGRGHARRVHGDPPPPPLLGHKRRRPAPARRVQHEVAGLGGHQQALLDHAGSCLDDIDLRIAEPALSRVIPNVVLWLAGEVVEIALEAKRVANCNESATRLEPCQTSEVRAESPVSRSELPTVECECTHIVLLGRTRARERIRSEDSRLVRKRFFAANFGGFKSPRCAVAKLDETQVAVVCWSARIEQTAILQYIALLSIPKERVVGVV